MNLDFSQEFQSFLDKLSHDSNETSWSFQYIDDFIVRVLFKGELNGSDFDSLANCFGKLQNEYFKQANYLIFIFDFTEFKKMPSDTRERLIESELFKNEKIDILLYGANYFVSTIAKIINGRFRRKPLLVTKNEQDAFDTARQLISKYLDKNNIAIGNEKTHQMSEQNVQLGNKSYKMITKQGWTYSDPRSDYSYKIDLIDDTIFIARPSGYISYRNSLIANVLFDKIINSEIGHFGKYYRIQDYTAVIGSENKARRDFTNYIISGIEQINLLVFYGLNRTMKIVVKLGKLVHPSFEKVKITDTFEEALQLVLAHKYKSVQTKESRDLSDPKATASDGQNASTNIPKPDYVKDFNVYKNLLFDRISKIAFKDEQKYIPVNIREDNLFYDLFSAVQLLHEDFSEFRSERDAIQAKLDWHNNTHLSEINYLKIENAAKLRQKNCFIRMSGHELNHSLLVILNAYKLLRNETDLEKQKSLQETINSASITLHEGIAQLKSGLDENFSPIVLSESLFNYRKNIEQLVEVAQINMLFKTIVFENRIESNFPTFLIGDKRKLSQVICIFLENAIKFTSKGFIKINTEVIHRSASQVHFRVQVTDSGIGMDEHTKNQLLNENESFDEQPIQQKKGDGWLIAKSIAKALNGKIGFESDPESYRDGIGSTFWFEATFNIGFHDKTAQMNTARLNKKYFPGQKSHAFEGESALFLMDDSVRQNLLAKILNNLGISERIKFNYESLESCTGDFRFVFLNIQLIGNEELQHIKQTISQLKAQNSNSNATYIAVADALIDPLIEDYRKAGIDYFIKKTFTNEDIEQFLLNLK